MRLRLCLICANYVVKSSCLLNFLESVPDISARLKPPTTADRKFEDVVKSAQDAAVLVLVYQPRNTRTTRKNQKAEKLEARETRPSEVSCASWLINSPFIEDKALHVAGTTEKWLPITREA